MSKHEVGIRNMDVYLTLMQKGMEEKLFFVDKLPEDIDTFVDFGCADGTMLRALSQLMPGSRLVGFDNSPDMIARARENLPQAELYTDWDSMDVNPAASCLILSSVIHEVYSYSPPEEIERFWRRVFGSGFRCVVIRDMMIDPEDAQPVSLNDLPRVRDHGQYGSVLAAFEAVNGEVAAPRDMIHFLLKYQYADNWEREVRENYLPLPLPDFWAKIPADYETIFFDHATLPWLAHCVRRDYGFDVRMKTHMKVVLERR